MYIKNKHIEFSKILSILVITIVTCIGIWSIIEYYTLVKLAIEAGVEILPDCTLPVTCITTILGVVLTYCLYQGALKTSLNKNKLKENKLTGIIEAINNCDVVGVISQTETDHTDEPCG